jgi:Sulfotransferase family
VKALFNPLIEQVFRVAFRVDLYADVFERAAMGHKPAPMLLRRILRRNMSNDVADSPILFIHVPKNGGTSVKHALYSSDPGHVTLRYYEFFHGDYLTTAQSFAILRDPVDRFLSGYDFMRQGGGKDVRIQPIPMQRMRGIDSIDGLLDFIEAARGDWLRVDTFLRPQWWYVTDRATRIGVQHLWTIEETGARMSAFLAEYGLPAIPHKNRTERAPREITDSQRARILGLYAPDGVLYETVRARGGYASDLAGVSLNALNSAETRASTTA